MASEVLRFAQLQSVVDVTFLAELSEYKLNVLKLSEEPVDITGFFHPNRYESVAARLQLDVSSLRPDATSRLDCHAAPGRLLLYNTIEGFRGCDKPALMRQAAAQVWADITSGAAEAEPWRLCRFLLLMHGDLKHYSFNYWFAFPALKPPAPFTCHSPPLRLTAALPPPAVELITAACSAWRYPATTTITATSPPSSDSPPSPPATGPATSPADVLARTPAPFWLLSSPEPDFSLNVIAHPLADWAVLRAPEGTTAAVSGGGAGVGEGEGEEGGAGSEAVGGGDVRWAGGRHVLLVFSDSSNQELHPAWQLRNALLMAAVRWRVRALQVLCLRESSRGGGRLDPDRSLLLQLALPSIDLQSWPQPGPQDPPGTGAGGSAAAHRGPCPEAVGWEANAQGRLLPRFLDLGPHLRPEAQAEQAVDLNLRLMRWRAVPELDVGAIAGTKCLLLGAGTLGCAVGRTLQAWGVRHITLVDSGRVAFSNPVRQSLYNFEDCLAGGRPKAEAAAEALRRIFPSAVTRGVSLSIPMPGHPPAGPEEERTLQEAAAQLDSLVSEHDVVFLLTDTRESRWLPALLAAVYGKLAITAAVGFDSFLVVRHGAPPGSANAPTPAPASASNASPASNPGPAASGAAAAGCAGAGAGRRLGCYFCNDVVAPANSTHDRSLDQQCTVARPGLAPMAGALAAELLAAAVAQQGGPGTAACAPPPSVTQQQQQRGACNAPLGPAPHMIRGQLSSFSQVLMEGWAFAQCTACSPTVVEAYRSRGWELVRAALQAPASLEALTGLTELHAAAAAAMMEAEGEEEEEGVAEGKEAGAGAEEGGQGEEGGEGTGCGDGGAEGRLYRADEGGEGSDDDDWTEL